MLPLGGLQTTETLSTFRPVTFWERCKPAVRNLQRWVNSPSELELTVPIAHTPVCLTAASGHVRRLDPCDAGMVCYRTMWQVGEENFNRNFSVNKSEQQHKEAAEFLFLATVLKLLSTRQLPRIVLGGGAIAKQSVLLEIHCYTNLCLFHK